MKPRLQEQYREICNKYVKLFCEKHEIEFEYWVDLTGGIASFGDIYYFSLSNIVEDLDNNYPKGLILKWIEDVVEYSELKGWTIPLSQYAKGERYDTPETTKEDWEYVKCKVRDEGFHYCFKHYSDFKDVIHDKMFHLLRQSYIDAADQLENYIESKIKSYE